MPELPTITLNDTDISPEKQVAFLKNGQIVLAGRYKKATNGKVFEGVLLDEDSGKDDATFSVTERLPWFK